MANPYYNHTSGVPAVQTRGSSPNMRAEFDAVATGFNGVYTEILALAAAVGIAVTVSEVPVASSATTDIGNGYGPVVKITGTNPITSFGANYKGAIFLRFADALLLTHSSSLVLPGAANITTVAGDACIAIPIGNPASGWRIAAYCRMSQGLIDDIAVKTSSTYADPAWLTSLAWSKITGRPTTLAGYGITDAPLKDGTGATGTWGINITGSAASIAAAVTASGLTMATNRLLGRSTASTGAVEEISVGSGLSLASGVLSADSVLAPPPVRQTVLSGPVDSSGLPNFGGSTGTTTVTATGTLVATAANGTANRTGQITNPSWTGLSTTGTMYLYLDIAANGTCTPGSTTLAPTYRWGGADVTTNNQFTFNIQEMVGKVGNGSAAVQTDRVFVGEVTVAAGVVTAITWYALMGRYLSAATATLPAAGRTSRNHNIGVVPMLAELWAECTTTDAGYAVGDVIKPTVNTSGSTQSNPLPVTRLTISAVGGNTASLFGAPSASTGAGTNLTPANWSWRLFASRGW